MNILEAGRALRARKVSSRELTEACLARIARDNEDLRAFITVMEETGLESARRADDELGAGNDRGPMHGIPIAHKDLFYTKGVRTTNGSKLFSDFVPDFDATVVERLDAAGAVLLGKTSLHELAYGITSNNPHFGTVRNPHDRERIPGGSSGGSGVAVAKEMAFMAMGSDTGGSIRIPAAFCGTVGLKATYGRVSRHGCFPLGLSLDHMGPLTRTVRDAALTLNAIAGHDPADSTSSGRATEDFMPPEAPSLAGVRIGRPEGFYSCGLDPDVRAALQRAVDIAEQMGARVVDVRTPDVDEMNAIARLTLLTEGAAVMRPYWHRRDEIGPDVRILFDQGRVIPATDYINGQRYRAQLAADFQKVFTQVDCLLTPTTPIPAPLIAQTTVTIDGKEEDTRIASTRLVRGINLLGLPALAIPCGWTASRLPLSLQLIARPFEERLLLNIGAALEEGLQHTIRA